MRRTGWVGPYEKDGVGGWGDVRRTGWVGRYEKDGVCGAI